MMTRTHVAFLRGISNIPMQPLREALERIDLQSIGSFGASGNLFFRTHDLDPASLEARIESAVGAEAIVRTRGELETIARQDPYVGRQGASVFLAKHPFDQMHVESMQRAGFEGEAPAVVGSTVYFVHPARRPGRQTVIDFERELHVRGTMRSSKVVARVLASM